MAMPAITRRNSTSRRVHRPTDGSPSCSRTGSRLCRLSLSVGSLMLVRSRQLQLVAPKRREVAVDFGIADAGERVGPPARPVVLVDDHGAHALVKIMPVDDARDYAEFGFHARREIHGGTAS